MSTSVVVEALPPPPPPSTVPADAAPTAAVVVSSPTAAPLANGVRVAAQDSHSNSNSNGAVPSQEDVDMGPADAPADAANAAAAQAPVSITDETSAATASDAIAHGESTAMPMEVDMPTTTTTTGEATQSAMREPVAYDVRSPADDARALAQAKRRLEIQIAFVENARNKIENESHPDFQERMVPIDADRDTQLAHAERQESYWANCTSVIFAYECDEASSEFLMNCDKLRHEMLDEIHHEMEIINDQRKGSSSARKTTRKTRSARSKGGGNGSSSAEEKLFPSVDPTPHRAVKKRVGNVFQHLENKLAQSEVDHDLRELHNSMDMLAKKRRVDATESPFVAKYHRANFLYRDAVYQEGDEIFVRNLMNGSEYIAVICSITSTELFVLSEKGKYFRLVLMDLRQGRVVVAPLSSDQTAALNEREALRI